MQRYAEPSPHPSGVEFPIWACECDQFPVPERRSVNPARLRLDHAEINFHHSLDGRSLLHEDGGEHGLLLFSKPKDIVDHLALRLGLGSDRAGILAGIDVKIAERLESRNGGREGLRERQP
jgi:hypothetical protein